MYKAIFVDKEYEETIFYVMTIHNDMHNYQPNLNREDTVERTLTPHKNICMDCN